MTQSHHLFRRLMSATALSLAGVSVFWAAPAAAQETSDSNEEEIIVTARKREERLQDVPISITVLSSDQLDRQGLDDFQDLGFSVANVAINEVGGTDQTRISMRGIEGRAGIYLDEVFVTDEAGFATSLIDIDRIEVLRGPQGTLFGRNNIAGVMSLYTREPSDDFSARADITYGDYGLLEGRASVSIPIIDGVLAASLSGVAKARDGYYHNRVTNSDIGAQSQAGLRGQILFTPTQALSVRLIADHVERDDEGNVFEYIANTSDPSLPFGGNMLWPPGPATRDGNPYDYSVESNVDNFARSETTGVTGRIDYDFSNSVTLTSITSRRTSNQTRAWDQDYTSFDIQSVRDFYRSSDEFSQELRLTGEWGSHLTWVFGGYYFERDSSNRFITAIGADYADATTFGFTLGTLNALFPALYPLPVLLTHRSANEERQMAAFASATYEFSDQWALTVGARYSHEEQKATVVSFDNIGGLVVPSVNYPADDPFAPSELTNNDLSPNVSLTYTPTPDITFYGTYSRGFSSGGFNTGLQLAEPVPGTTPRTFDPETVSSYEIGVKGNAFDSLNYAAAIFYLDYTDRQVYTTIGGVSFVGNVGEANIQGAEAEAHWAATDNLNINATIGYQETEITSAPLAGKELPFAPHLTGNLGAEYRIPLAGGSLVLGGQTQYRGSNFLNQANTPAYASDSIWLYNASIGWDSPDGHFGIALQGFNLSDEVYWTNMDDNSGVGGIAAALSDPRRVQLQIRARY